MLKKLLKIIQRVFDSYLLEINEVKVYKETMNIEEIDSLIKIDDSSAINAILELEKKLLKEVILDSTNECSSKYFFTIKC